MRSIVRPRQLKEGKEGAVQPPVVAAPPVANLRMSVLAVAGLKWNPPSRRAFVISSLSRRPLRSRSNLRNAASIDDTNLCSCAYSANAAAFYTAHHGRRHALATSGGRPPVGG